MKDMNLSDSEKAHIFSELKKSISQSHNNQSLSLPYIAEIIHEYKMPGELYTIQENYKLIQTTYNEISAEEKNILNEITKNNRPNVLMKR
jgi:hypothetical protein